MHELTPNEFIIIFMLLHTKMSMKLMRNNSCGHWCCTAIKMDWLHWNRRHFFTFVFLAKRHKSNKGQGLDRTCNTRANGKDHRTFKVIGVARVCIWIIFEHTIKQLYIHLTSLLFNIAKIIHVYRLKIIIQGSTCIM